MDETDIVLHAAVAPTEIELYLRWQEVKRQKACYDEAVRILDVSAQRAAQAMVAFGAALDQDNEKRRPPK